MPPKKNAPAPAGKPVNKVKKAEEGKAKPAGAKAGTKSEDKKYVLGLATILGIDMEEDDPHDDERHDPAGFTKDYLQRTSLHGLQ